MEWMYELGELPSVIQKVLASVARPRIWALHGEMGAGKTTFVHALCDAWGVEDVVSSPTFSIINEYRTKNDEVLYHIDLYRLGGEDEARQAGVEDCFYSGATCLVEWPEKAPGLFPPDAIHLYLAVTGQTKRRLKINGN
jgi:tRNA threonylcarbamoyladenosine biosynthesis protein TsaE